MAGRCIGCLLLGTLLCWQEQKQQVHPYLGHYEEGGKRLPDLGLPTWTCHHCCLALGTLLLTAFPSTTTRYCCHRGHTPSIWGSWSALLPPLVWGPGKPLVHCNAKSRTESSPLPCPLLSGQPQGDMHICTPFLGTHPFPCFQEVQEINPTCPPQKTPLQQQVLHWLLCMMSLGIAMPLAQPQLPGIFIPDWPRGSDSVLC